MAYKQIKSFSTSKAGKKAGYCLQNVRLGYGIAPKYESAIEAWDNTQQHKDQNWPSGCDVPLFYSWESEGHVNVRLANGKVWSDGSTYANLDAFLKSHTPKYLGWGESLNGVRVIQAVVSSGVKIVVKKGTWNVRSGAGTSYKVLGIAKGGQTYSATIQSNGWGKITFNGKTGYIAGSGFTKG